MLIEQILDLIKDKVRDTYRYDPDVIYRAINSAIRDISIDFPHWFNQNKKTFVYAADDVNDNNEMEKSLIADVLFVDVCLLKSGDSWIACEYVVYDDYLKNYIYNVDLGVSLETAGGKKFYSIYTNKEDKENKIIIFPVEKTAGQFILLYYGTSEEISGEDLAETTSFLQYYGDLVVYTACMKLFENIPDEKWIAYYKMESDNMKKRIIMAQRKHRISQSKPRVESARTVALRRIVRKNISEDY